MHAAIFTRKSVRKFSGPLDAGQLEQLNSFLRTLVPLIPDIKVQAVIAQPETMSWISSSPIPQFLAIGSQQKPLYLTNVGFLFQQVDLYLSKNGLGSYWIGFARPKPSLELDFPYVISLAFGMPQGFPHRQVSEFRRRPLKDISHGEDERLEAARLAPSSQNSQPWYFYCEDGKVHLYRQIQPALKAVVLSYFNKIDVGIALYHLKLATEKQGKTFYFHILNAAPEVQGYEYVGTVD